MFGFCGTEIWVKLPIFGFVCLGEFSGLIFDFVLFNWFEVD